MPRYMEIDLGVCAYGHNFGKGVNALNFLRGIYHAVNGVARLRRNPLNAVGLNKLLRASRLILPGSAVRIC